jgi:glycosyltransferase involved in cell wall biosynthesis
MRILMTVPSLAREFGGPVGKAHSLATALRRIGEDVVLVGAGTDDVPGVVALGSIGRFHGTPVPSRVGPLRRAIRGADVVHVIGFRDPVGTIAAWEARRGHVPYVLEPAGMVRPRMRSFALKRGFDASLGPSVMERADAIIVASSVEAEDLARAGVPEDRIRVRPNGVDFDGLLPLPTRGATRKRLSIPTDAPLVVTLARIGAIKGLPVMARSLRDLPGVWWLLAGPDERDGTLRAVRAALAAAGVADRAVIEPRGLWGDDKRQALADADVFCLPSEYESFGTAALEAAGAGLPVVMTDRCGAKDVLDGRSFSHVRAGDPVELAVAIDRHLRTPRRPGKLEGSSGELRSRLSWSAVAALQEEIYASSARA